MTQRQVAENKEIMSIVKTLGLTFGQKGDQQKMRYGSVMIMADQDYDGWHVKYYKGLGTSTAAEAKAYFQAMEDHRLYFDWTPNKDGEIIDMASARSGPTAARSG